MLGGGSGAQNGKGGPKWPELRIKTVIKLCIGISQNYHLCLAYLFYRSGGRYLFTLTHFAIQSIDCRFELALDVQKVD